MVSSRTRSAQVPIGTVDLAFTTEPETRLSFRTPIASCSYVGSAETSIPWDAGKHSITNSAAAANPMRSVVNERRLVDIPSVTCSGKRASTIAITPDSNKSTLPRSLSTQTILLRLPFHGLNFFRILSAFVTKKPSINPRIDSP